MISKNNITKYQEKIVLIILVNIFLLWLLNIQFVHIHKFLPDATYYAKHLSIFYWAGTILIILLLLLFIFLESIPTLNINKYKNLLLIILVAFYLHATSSFIFTNPRTMDTYKVIMFTDYFLLFKEGLLRTSGVYINQFPGSILLFNIVCQVTNSSSFFLSKYFQIFSVLLSSLFIYLISTKLLDKYHFVAPIIYISTTWIAQFHLCPQSHAIMLISIMIFFITLCFLRNFKDSNMLFLALLTWLALSFSHPSTTIFTLIALSFVPILYIFFKKFELRYMLHRSGISFNILLLVRLMTTFIVIFVGYVIFNSDFIISEIISTINTIIESFIETDEYVTIVDRAWVAPSASYLFGYYCRLFNMIMVLIIGFLCIFSLSVLFYKFEYCRHSQRFQIIIFYIGALFVGYSSVLIMMSVSGYNTYGGDRNFLYSLLPFSILCTALLNVSLDSKKASKKWINLLKEIICIFIILSIVIFPIIAHANDPYNFVSESELKGNEFGFNMVTLTTDRSHYYVSLAYPVSSAYYTHRYNYIAMKQQQEDEYQNKFYSKGSNIIYNSGQSKISEI